MTFEEELKKLNEKYPDCIEVEKDNKWMPYDEWVSTRTWLEEQEAKAINYEPVWLGKASRPEKPGDAFLKALASAPLYEPKGLRYPLTPPKEDKI
jgi:hypothetical protein